MLKYNIRMIYSTLKCTTLINHDRKRIRLTYLHNLNPGRLLGVGCGNGHMHFKSYWRGLEPPRHLRLFSTKTFLQIAEKAGFNKYRVWTTASRVQFPAAASLAIKNGLQQTEAEDSLRVDVMAMFSRYVRRLLI